MSYEHCERHNADATNGCEQCEKERANTFAFRGVAGQVAGVYVTVLADSREDAWNKLLYQSWLYNAPNGLQMLKLLYSPC